MIIDGNNFIAHKLKNNESFVAGKIGVTELNLLYIAGKQLPEYLKHEAEDQAGLYPYTEKTVFEFSNNMYQALDQVDLIPVWNKVIPHFEQQVLNTYCSHSYKTELQHLEPYFFEKPWTKHLKNKKVLIFSPFAKSIEQNYKVLDKIWCNKIQPNFDLKVYRYPFALKISPSEKYKVSDDVYKEFLSILRNEDFDVGIFGTGYTSLLFAAECKKIGKVGIHLGGPTQILFGIKGQRWRDIQQFHPFFNKYWTDPLEEEKPIKRDAVEGGCYW